MNNPFGVKKNEAYGAPRGKRGNPSQNSQPQLTETEWELQSGVKTKFIELVIPAEDVEKLTYVEKANGRNQKDLTPESLAPITHSMRKQQYYPAICQKKGDKYSVFDGSRRRMGAIYSESPLHILYSTDDISLADTKALIKELQSGLEYSLRDWGEQFEEFMIENGCDQKAVAVEFGVSTTKVSNALCAWRTSDLWLSVFPEINKLSIAAFKDLSRYEEVLVEKNLEVGTLIESVKAPIAGLPVDIKDVERQKRIMALIKNAFSELLAKPKASKNKPTPLYSFTEKNRYARLKRNNDKVSFEFSRIDSSIIQDIEQYISKQLESHYGSTDI